MHIKDLTTDVELDSTALAAVRGGTGAIPAEPPSCYTGACSQGPSGWPAFNTADIKAYISDVKAGAGFPSAEVRIPDMAIPKTPDLVFQPAFS